MTEPPDKRYLWRRFVDLLKADSDGVPTDEYLLEELPRIFRERIKKITGLSDWKDDPARTLSTLGEEIDDEATARANADTALQTTLRQYADDAAAGIVDSSPKTLDTLRELAAALGDDPNFATTVAQQIGERAKTSETPVGDPSGGQSGWVWTRTISGMGAWIPRAESVPPGRRIDTGPGLTGGGDLSDDLTLTPRVYAFARADRNNAPNQNVSYGTDVKIELQNVTEDTHGCFANGRYTAKIAGRYSVLGMIRMTGLVAGDVVALYVAKNGSRTAGADLIQTNPATTYCTVGGPAAITLMAGEYVELFARVNGNAGAPLASGPLTYMSVGYWGAL